MICEKCGKEHDGTYGSGRFCCKECARSFSTINTRFRTKEILCSRCSKKIIVNIRYNNVGLCQLCKSEIKALEKYKKYENRNIEISQVLDKVKSENDINNIECKIFNIECKNCYFNINKICKSKASIRYQLNTLSKYCGLKISSYDNTVKQYIEIKNNLQLLIDNGLSSVELCEKLTGSSKKGNTIYKILNLKNRSLSESVANAFIQGRVKCKEGFHVSWNGKEVYLRSSYEFDYANELDIKKIDYEVESLKIKYWDTQNQKYRLAIPDFYLTESNTIVEIKSSWTLDEQLMKDRKKAFEENGYKFILYVDHEIVNI